MIEVIGLHKSYSSVGVLHDISFKATKGVIGFLGPNGAGKSTTMKILSGCLSADAGEVRVCGFDILTQSRQARQQIGFMTESTSVDEEMKVKDFLHFRGLIKGLTKKSIHEKVEHVISTCSLEETRDRKIGHLSKGFKQRVGLADALIHDPAVLVLDEPTSGLDPNQIKSMRKVIKKAGENSIVILSSHLLAEVESTCDDVIILHKGRILTQGPLGEIKKRLGNTDQISLVVAGDQASIKKCLSSIQGVLKYELVSLANNETKVLITLAPGVTFDESKRLIPEIARGVINSGLDLLGLNQQSRNLEDIFESLTQGNTNKTKGDR